MRKEVMNAKYKNVLMIVLLLLPSINQAVERKLKSSIKEKKSLNSGEIDKNEEINKGNENLFTKVLQHIPVKHKTLKVNATAGGFSPDSKKVITGSGFRDNLETNVWDANTADHLLTIKEKRGGLIDEEYFNPIGNEMVIRVNNEFSRTWLYIRDAKTGNYLYKSEDGNINSILFSPDGAYIMYQMRDNDALHVLDAKNKTCLYTLKNAFNPLFRSDGNYIATLSKDDKIQVWDTKTGKSFRVFDQKCYNGIYTFNVNNRIISPGSIVYQNDTSIWNVDTGKCIVLKQPGKNSCCVDASTYLNDAKIATAALKDGTVSIWDGLTGKQVQEFNVMGRAPNYVGWIRAVFCRKNKTLVTSTEDNITRIWNIKNGTCLHKMKNETAQPVPNPDGTFFALSANEKNRTKIIDAKTGLLLAVLKGRMCINTGSFFSPDSTKAITCSSDEKVKETYISDLSILKCTLRDDKVQ